MKNELDVVTAGLQERIEAEQYKIQRLNIEFMELKLEHKYKCGLLQKQMKESEKVISDLQKEIKKLNERK